MAGVKGKSGPKPKPKAVHDMHGTTRNYHQPDLASEVKQRSLPVAPTGLGDAGRELWNKVARLVPAQIVGELDYESLFLLCNTYELYLAALDKAKTNPIDKVFRAAVIAYASQFDKLACQFGLTPTSRAQLKMPAKVEEENPLNELLGRLKGRG